jgi:predicted metal-dependent phosphotriesterase family hydrolase
VSGLVRTVRGDIDAAELGPTYCHEHLLTKPGAHLVHDDPDLVLDDEEKAAAELGAFRRAGGRSLVEVTTPEFGRDPAGLRRLSQRAQVHVIATAGHVSEEYWRGVLDLESRSEAALVRELVRDVEEGMDESGVRAGVIKVGTSNGAATRVERKIISAAGLAQRETGAAITTHTTAGTAALEQARLLEQAGADLSRVCVGHIDRRLVWTEHIVLARLGIFLGYDCISKEQYQPDAARARFIARLFEEGFGGQVCLSADLARRRYLEAWGGAPGYRYILERFLPLLREAGLSEEDTRRLVVDNPARLLARK